MASGKGELGDRDLNPNRLVQSQLSCQLDDPPKQWRVSITECRIRGGQTTTGNRPCGAKDRPGAAKVKAGRGQEGDGEFRIQNLECRIADAAERRVGVGDGRSQKSERRVVKSEVPRGDTGEGRASQESRIRDAEVRSSVSARA